MDSEFAEDMSNVINLNFNVPEESEGWSYYQCTPDEQGDWFIADDGIYHSRDTRDGVVQNRVSGQPIYIKDRAIDLDSGMESITVVWEDGSKIREYTLRRKDVSTSGGVMSLADRGYAVNAGNARHIVNYLAHLLDFQKDNIPIRHIVSSCGTKTVDGVEAFCIGDNVVSGQEICPEISFNPNMDVDGFVSNLNSRKDGDLAEWVKTAHEIGEYPMAAFGVAASFLAPLLKDLEIGNNLIIDYGGISSSGKTTTLKLCASVWGYPLESDGGLIRSWTGTQTFFERYGAIMNELPIFLDESHKANPKDAGKIIYQYANGSGSGRAKTNGTQKSTKYRGVLFSAGEARLTDVDKNEGVNARVIGFWDSPFGKDKRELVRRINIASEKHYGLAGIHVLQKYLLHRDEVLPKLKEMHRKTTERLTGLVDDRIGQRLASYFGAIYATGTLANSVLGMNWDVKSIVDEAFRLSVNNRPPSIAQECIELVGEWIASNQANFADNDKASVSDVLYGRIFFDKENREKRIGILHNALQSLLKQHDYSYESVVQQWLGKGWLDTDHGRHKKKVRLGKSSVYMLVLNKSGISASNGGASFDDHTTSNPAEEDIS